MKTTARFASLALLLISTTATAEKLEISVVTDWETVQKYGSVEGARSEITAALDYAIPLLESQLGLDVVVTYVEIPNNEAEDKIEEHTSITFLKPSIINHRVATPQHASADITLFLSIRRLNIGSTEYGGFASQTALCNEGNAVAAVKLGLWDTGRTTAHEIGHVLGAHHDGDKEGTCPTEPRGFLMGLNADSDTFSTCSKQVIEHEVKNFGTCLREPVVEAPPASAPPASTTSPKTESTGGGGGSMDLFWIFGLLSLTFFGPRRKRS